MRGCARLLARTAGADYAVHCDSRPTGAWSSSIAQRSVPQISSADQIRSAAPPAPPFAGPTGRSPLGPAPRAPAAAGGSRCRRTTRSAAPHPAGEGPLVTESHDVEPGGGTLTATPSTPTTEQPAADAANGRPRRRSAGLSGMLLPELQQLAGDLGIPGTAKMRKGQLIEAIQTKQAGGPAGNGHAHPVANGATDRGVKTTAENGGQAAHDAQST